MLFWTGLDALVILIGIPCLLVVGVSWLRERIARWK